MENVEDADWENNWKQFYKPMEIGERLLVVPEWEQAQEDGRVKLVLNPGLTFGTGSHATTRLCLQALEQHIHGGEKGFRPRLRQRHSVHRRAAARREGRLCL